MMYCTSDMYSLLQTHGIYHASIERNLRLTLANWYSSIGVRCDLPEEPGRACLNGP